MFEKEIKFIGDFCLNQVKYLGSHFTFQKITATELHPAILRYISAELEFMIYSDRQKLLQNSYFDYSGKEISEYFRKINYEIKKTKRIAFDDAKKLILQAVSFNANYVVKPNWSLSQLIYNDQDTINIDELEMMLNYIYYYEHLKKVLLAYLRKRNIVQISKTEFDLILKKIDQELVRSNADQLIHNALASIGDFFNIGGVERNLVSPVAVEIFLKEKSLFNHLLKLRKGISDPAKKKYTTEAIKRSIYAEDVIEVEEEQEVDIEKVDENLGELADKHAQNLDKAGADDFINLEEEEALLALYEEELKDSSVKEVDDFIEDDVKEEIVDKEAEIETETPVENAEQPELNSTGKEIVHEMINEYFEGEAPENKDETADQETTEAEEEQTAEDIKEKKPSSIEDEMLEVFEGLEKEGLEDQKEKTSDAEAIINEGSTETEEKIEIEEENDLTDQDVIVNEIETATSNEENITPVEVKAEEDESEEQLEEDQIIRKKDLFSYLSRKETRKILSHIFLKDEEDFTNTVEKIMECGSYKEASDILRSVFNSYKVSPYAKDAVNFTNAVSNYFRQV